jgi:nitroimidazol reductase NimA-like FMN-containing flavoprotein (pyridoxamine 5'-phosphate oxidase superfamily)
MTQSPVTELDSRFSDSDAEPTSWDDATAAWSAAQVYWLTTVRPDGRPHVTPLVGVWSDGAAHFCTGPAEQKARNLAANPAVALTTGRNSMDEGLDMVIEGRAERVTDDDRLRLLADAYVDKYGPDWTFEVQDGAFRGGSGRAVVFAVRPVVGYGFAKGATFGQTRWRFEQ